MPYVDEVVRSRCPAETMFLLRQHLGLSSVETVRSEANPASQTAGKKWPPPKGTTPRIRGHRAQSGPAYAEILVLHSEIAYPRLASAHSVGVAGNVRARFRGHSRRPLGCLIYRPLVEPNLVWKIIIDQIRSTVWSGWTMNSR